MIYPIPLMISITAPAAAPHVLQAQLSTESRKESEHPELQEVR